MTSLGGRAEATERERSTPTEPELLRACEEVVARYDGPGTAFEAFQRLRDLFPGSADAERLEREVQDLRATTTGPAWDKYHNAVTRAENAERERDEARAEVTRLKYHGGAT